MLIIWIRWQIRCSWLPATAGGAAVANVLGARLTDRFGLDNVFVYTFATPRTVRGDYPDYSNIFNVINPADLVTYLPFPQWGFERYGIDVELPAGDASLAEAAEEAYALRSDRTGVVSFEPDSIQDVQKLEDAMASLAPDVETGYTFRHALAHPGEAKEGEDWMTADAVMLMIFEGSLRTGNAPSETFMRLTASLNDFTPLLSALQASGGSLITVMHMPAVYGAWLTAMTPNVP